ncbi:MAG: alcohol dehydrogenase catalytic domain-containing protein [Candidatus Nitrosoabyssus spongiisocia]|nr:MAG: alcohol dehydrogenase catalytic domain-containing protein [Nitrosopumilaceae archaeon AB1(1)]
MSDMMRAMILSKLAPIEERPLKLQNVIKHKVETPNQILLKIEACGVCHSQLHSIEGDWKDLDIPPSLPTIPGHEVVGKVVEIGSAVTKFAVGDRAGISPLLESCMNCDYCKDGKEQLCESMDVLGETLRGGYAEYVNVSEDFATKIPESMSSEYATPLFCAGITAFKAVKAAEPDKNKRVGIFGIGGVGHMAIQFAKIAGFQVFAISRNQRHLDVALKLGADDSILYDENTNTITSKIGLLDAAIVFAPSDRVTASAIQSVKKGGLIVLATIGKIPNFVAFEEKTIRGTLIGSMADMRMVVELAQKHNLSVVTESFKLEDANEVLLKLKNSQIDARAVLIP